ncbi:MAG: TetR/AcrR family transcriptional regulator [Solirubrobacteraceae bacterium]
MSAATGVSAPPLPAGKRERTKAQNRSAILAAARAVFAALGYEAASVRDVVRGTGLASGTFYNYFPDKESVLRALVEEDAALLRARLREVRAAATTLESFVGDAYRVYFAWIAEDPAAFELVRRNAGSIRQLIDEPALGGGVDDLRDDLRAATAQGELPLLDADYMAAAMAGVAIEVAVRMVERDPPDVEGAARFATELFVGGIERLARARVGPGGATRVAN